MSKDSGKWRPAANPDKARADAERARSNAAGTHKDKRQKRRRTRNAADSHEIGEQREV